MLQSGQAGDFTMSMGMAELQLPVHPGQPLPCHQRLKACEVRMHCLHGHALKLARGLRASPGPQLFRKPISPCAACSEDFTLMIGRDTRMVTIFGWKFCHKDRSFILCQRKRP